MILRQETESQLLRKKYGRPSGILWRWAAGTGPGGEEDGRSQEQINAEESAKTVKQVRESVLWFLRRSLEQVAGVQRGMVEKRIERVREKEKSVLYKASLSPRQLQQQQQQQAQKQRENLEGERRNGQQQQKKYESSTALSAEEAAAIESQLTPEQLQLFAEENDMMLRHYEDTLSKVQSVFSSYALALLHFRVMSVMLTLMILKNRNAEKSLIEISSLQQTLVGHLSTQEEYISQLVADASTTSENVGKGNKELKRASERRSTAQMVFWATTGLCAWLILWDAVF